MTRIFQQTSLVINTEINLDERATHYLSHVLRAKINDEIILFNGIGGEYRAKILAISKKNIRVCVTDFSNVECESGLDLQLAQGITRGEKMDFIIQKAVELGVKKVMPMITERCNVNLDEKRQAKRHAHWEGIIISACEQSGRNRLPVLEKPVAMQELLQKVQGDKIILSPHADEPFSATGAMNTIALFIGPEGGFSKAEIELAKERDAQFLQLGPRILRTETASLAAITLIQSTYGDMR